MSQTTTNPPTKGTPEMTTAHPSTWVPVRCANEADASLRNGWLPDGAGAQYLLSVVSSLLEAIADEPDEDRSDQVAHAADSNISVYTLQQWDTFHDLMAWSEDDEEVHSLSDWGFKATPVRPVSLTSIATAAIYLIGSRLAHSVVHYLDALDNEEDE